MHSCSGVLMCQRQRPGTTVIFCTPLLWWLVRNLCHNFTNFILPEQTIAN
jgi:hypothetical protein